MQTKKNERFLHICNELSAELGKTKMEQLVRGVGVDPKHIADQDISTLQEAQLLRDACTATGDNSFAASIGTRFRHAQTLTGYIAKSSETLRAAIRNSAKYYTLSDEDTKFELTGTDTRDILKVANKSGSLLRHHRFQEFLVFGLLTRLRVLSDRDFYPERLCLQHDVRKDLKTLEKLAGCSVEPLSGFNGIVFRSSTLDAPLPNYEPGLVSYLSELGASLLKQKGGAQDNVRDQVERLLINHLPGRILTADEAAGIMGKSRRTLTRQLTAEGTGFREIVDELRFDIAKTYLSDGLNITEIAFYLGYADHAAFSTAFSRWAGQSPRAFQKSHKEI